MTVYVTSDLHLKHKNIIRYCDRPFQTVEVMDKTLIDNWNATVKPEDTVYFLGDLTIKRGKKAFEQLLSELNGEKILIKGNHDPDDLNLPVMIFKEIDGIQILFTHNPADIPEGYSGWTIHGHHHNRYVIDPEGKRINVSTENTGYKPIELGAIISQIKQIQTEEEA